MITNNYSRRGETFHTQTQKAERAFSITLLPQAMRSVTVGCDKAKRCS